MLVFRKQLGFSGRELLCRILCKSECSIKHLCIPGKSMRTEAVDEGDHSTIYSANRLSDLDISELMDALEINESVKALDLTNQYIGDSSAQRIGDALQDNLDLKYLNLQGNYIGNKSLSYLMKGLAENETVEKLNLAMNCIGDEGLDESLHVLISNSTLKSLDLRYNDIGLEAEIRFRSQWKLSGRDPSKLLILDEVCY